MPKLRFGTAKAQAVLAHSMFRKRSLEQGSRPHKSRVQPRTFVVFYSRMRVCIDIQSAIAQRAGVGRYTKMLVEHLGPLRGEDELDLFYFDFKRQGVPFPIHGARQRPVHWFPGRVAQRAWRTWNAPAFDLFSGPADVFHFPNFIRPPLRSGKSVVTIHDVAFLRFPETIERKNYQYLTSRIRDTVERADAIITVSQFTARECAELLNVPHRKLFPIASGVEQDVQRPGKDALALMRRELNLERPYLLTVGTLEPRKNIGFLIDVFDMLGGFDGDLVVAGMRGWKYEPVLERIAASPKRDRIRYVEYVNERLLGPLYAAAELFVFPSLYEGFGFTPLEAMQVETPVLCSAAGSLPEVLGDAAVIVNEWNVDAWTAAVSKMLTDSAARRTHTQKGLEQVRRFTWEETARKTWSVYRGLNP
jgi:glycosyltransferase involved in cell wall biosynthesis